MIYTPMVNKAIRLLYEKHKDQVDKAGLPYVFHPFHVAESMQDEARTIVALLHDTVEDTDLTFEELEAMGFGTDVVDALKCMTHQHDEDYFEYVKRVGTNPIAIDVKLSDLAHNMDSSRLCEIEERMSKEELEKFNLKRASKYEKYQKSVEYLTALKNK